jgi:uncharacterized peroxidase-related enzyme
MSTRLTALEPTTTTGKTKELLDAVQSKMKMVPNMIRIMANSPATLQSYLSFNDALSRGILPEKLREQISIIVAETNACLYCLSAHTAIGKSLGLTDNDIQKAQYGKANDPKTEAALTFAKNIVMQRGKTSDIDLQKVKDAGYSEAEISEIIANVALNNYTNYFNHIAKTEIDFPKTELLTVNS